MDTVPAAMPGHSPIPSVILPTVVAGSISSTGPNSFSLPQRSQPGPSTPGGQTRGRGNNRGKKGGGGHSRGTPQHNGSYHYYPDQGRYAPGTSSVPYGDRHDNHYHAYNTSSLPVHNRFSPLRDARSYDQYHTRNDYAQSPYQHNQRDSQGGRGFHEDHPPRRKDPNPREDVEEDTGYRKEKRRRV